MLANAGSLTDDREINLREPKNVDFRAGYSIATALAPVIVTVEVVQDRQPGGLSASNRRAIESR